MKKFDAWSIINYFFCIVVVFIMVYPVWYVLMYSLSDPSKATLNHYFFLPNGFSLETYKHILKHSVIYTGFKNSVIVTLLGTLIGLTLSVSIGYPLSKDNLFGRRFFFLLMLFTMLFSAGLIPTYLLVRGLGMVDSLWALILPNALSPFYTLIMMKFFKGIPNSLIDSAKIDGYNEIAILFKIVLPLSPAVLATVGLFCAVWRWNEYLPGVMYIVSTEKRVLQVILRSMLYTEEMAGQVGDQHSLVTPQHMKMATIIVTMLPIMLVYPFLQKYFMHGVMLGSVKE